MATMKQKRAAKIKLENPGLSMRQVLKQANFSKAVQDHPKDVTDSKGWNELMEEFLPDKHLTYKHREFLDSPRIISTYQRGEITNVVEETSPQAVKALDIAYKIKNKYKDININQALIVNLSESVAKKYGINGRAGQNSQ